MLLKFFFDYPYIVYSIIVWGYILIFIGLEGIKRLWPISILSAFTIFFALYWLVSVGLYKIEITFLLILGIPFFLILWGAGNGIIFAYYFGEKIHQKIISILGFSVVTVLFEFFVENNKRVEHLGKFTNIHEFFYDVIMLSTLGLMMTIFFGNRLKKE